MARLLNGKADMKPLVLITMTVTACSGSGSADDPVAGTDAGGEPGECRTYTACQLTSQTDFAAAIGSSIAPHEKPPGNSRQIYHCAVDANGDEPFADVSINCRTDGRSHEQYMLAHDAARELEGFEEVGDLGRAAFWIATAPGNGSLEVEVDNARVLIVSVFSVPDGRELAGARALAEAVLSDL